MKLLEYEAKSLLAQLAAPLPHSELISQGSTETSMSFPLVLKVQIPIGGRGKAGGIVTVDNEQEFREVKSKLLSQPVKGYMSEVLLAEQRLSIAREMYLSIITDRKSQQIVLLASGQGGTDVEDVAESQLLRMPLPTPPTDMQIADIRSHMTLPENLTRQLRKIVAGLYEAFIANDAVLLEINPLVLTDQDMLVCADAKIELDDAAAFRHPDWQFAAKPASAQFVPLDHEGTVASMANGAGLAMATVDAIQAAGGVPANFLDIGGGTTTEGMVAALEKMSNIPSVKAIIINVFAGITRCDEVAEAIIIASQKFQSLPPLFIRLSGTNETKGRELLSQKGISTLPTLSECVEAAMERVSHVS